MSLKQNMENQHEISREKNHEKYFKMFRCPAKVLCWATTGGTEDAGAHETFDRRNRSYFGEIDLTLAK